MCWIINFSIGSLILYSLLVLIITGSLALQFIFNQVTEIDDGLLHLKNLKQLTLSANLIKHVDSKRLPKDLEVLVI